MQQTTIKQTDTQQIKSHYEPTAISKIIFASRWLQLPIYLGLIIVQGIYAYKFMKIVMGVNCQPERNGFQYYHAGGVKPD